MQQSALKIKHFDFDSTLLCFSMYFSVAKMGSQVLVPFRGSEDSHRHLKLMGDLGQVNSCMDFFIQMH